MCRRLALILSILHAAGVSAFSFFQAPAPIQWVKAPVGAQGKPESMLVMSPENLQAARFGSSQNLIISTPASLQLGSWTAREARESRDREIPAFIANFDKTITWAETGMCVEAAGDRSGDTVRVSQCTGGAAQKWTRIPGGRGQEKIQLQNTNKCLDVADAADVRKEASVVLKTCDEASESWKFAEAIASDQPVSAGDEPASFSFVLASLGLAAFLPMWSVLLWKLQSRGSARRAPLRAQHGGVALTASVEENQRATPFAQKFSGVWPGHALRLPQVEMSASMAASGALPDETKDGDSTPDKTLTVMAVGRSLAKLVGFLLPLALLPAIPVPMRKRILAGTLSAALASAIITPIVQVIEAATVMVSSCPDGKTRLIPSMLEKSKEWIRNPIAQLRGVIFQLIWLVYFLTYLCANSVTTVCAYYGLSAVIPNLVLTTATNMASCIYKDQVVAKVCDISGDDNVDKGDADVVEEKSFPLASYLYLVVRDVLTIGFVFVLPTKISTCLNGCGMKRGAGITSLLLCPSVVVPLTLPFHLIALDTFSFQKSSFRDRIGRVAVSFKKLLAIWVIRALASFGFGSVGNSEFLELFAR